MDKKIFRENKGSITASFLCAFFIAGTLVLFSATKENIGMSFGIGLAEIGILLTVKNIVSGFLPFFSGGLSDKYGRKIIILIGILFFFLYYLIVLFSKSYPMLIFALVLLGAAVAFTDTASMSVLFDVFPDANHVMPYLQILFSAGAFTSPLIASFFLGNNMDWRFAYYVLMAVMVFTAFLVIVSKYPKTYGNKNEEEKKELDQLENTTKKALFLREGIIICIYVLFITAFSSMVSNWTDIYMKDVFHYSQSAAIRIFSIYQIGGLAGAFATIRLTRVFHSTSLLIGYPMFGFAFFVLGILMNSPLFFTISIFIVGAAIGTLYSILAGYAGGLFRSNAGFMTGTLSSFSAIGASLSSFVCGRLLSAVHIRSMYGFASFLLLFVIVLSLVIRRHYKNLADD